MIDNDKINDLKNYYKENDNKVNGMKLKKWLNNEHPEIKESLENELMIYPNLTNISNIIGCIVHEIPLDSFKCRICGKQLKIKNMPSYEDLLNNGVGAYLNGSQR